MDFLNGKIKTLYFKYLAAAFGSALVTSIYSIVDMAMVGKYHGPAGTAALAVVAPVWNIIYSLGPFDGDRWLCPFQHNSRQRGRGNTPLQRILYRFHGGLACFGPGRLGCHCLF